jgi:outer membrane protein assembly factor BamE (lipoprotein component of BamABCDE complex)
MKKSIALSICVSIAAFSLVACDPVREEKGYRLDKEQMALVETGVSTKDDVVEKMGSPSSVSTFPDAGEAWYYIGKKTEHIAFLEKDIIEQNVIVILFDESEVVKEIKNYDKSDSREIDVVERTTPTGGNKLGFFEQIFGNFGRFNTGQ